MLKITFTPVFEKKSLHKKTPKSPCCNLSLLWVLTLTHRCFSFSLKSSLVVILLPACSHRWRAANRLMFTGCHNIFLLQIFKHTSHKMMSTPFTVNFVFELEPSGSDAWREALHSDSAQPEGGVRDMRDDTSVGGAESIRYNSLWDYSHTHILSLLPCVCSLKSKTQSVFHCNINKL